MKYREKFISTSTTLFLLFFTFGILPTKTFAYSTITALISPNGDVAPITVNCTVGHAYTEAVYNNSLSYMLENYPGISNNVIRQYCATGSITFAGWNMNTLLDSVNGVDNWQSYVRPPFKYEVIDSTNQGGCASSIDCSQYSLRGPWNGYRYGIYAPSNICYNTEYNENACTLAVGPVWTTTAYSRVWKDPRDDIPVPQPVGDPADLPAQISPTGDVPSVSIDCIPGHDYTLALVHETNGTVDYSPGVIQRIYCYPGIHNNVIAFNAFNIPSLLSTHIDPAWWNYVRTPLEYIIKDTTGIFQCDDESCPAVNEDGYNFDKTLYLASSQYWKTVGVGPIFDITDQVNHVNWYNVNNHSGNSNVLFLPGIEGSRLYRPSKVGNIFGFFEDRIWEPQGDSDVQQLYMDKNGKSINTDVYTRDVVDAAYPPVGPKIYSSFINMLSTMKGTDHSIADYSIVPYDWRLSLDDILKGGITSMTTSAPNISYLSTSSDPYILSELRRLVLSSKSGKVTIVAHSNGGLVAKALLKKLQDAQDPLLNKIDRLILVAVPQLGTPAAIAANLHGIEQGIPSDYHQFLLSKNVARGFAVNSPMAYNLLPSANYFTYIDNPVVTFDSTLPQWNSLYGSSTHSTDRLQNFILDTYGRVSATSTVTDTPNTLNAYLFDQAQKTHALLDAWTPPPSIDVIEIAGWGIPTTLSGIAYTTNKGAITPQPITTIDGDGVVVTPSALWANGGNVTRYWVDEGKWNGQHPIKTLGGFLPRKHPNIFEIPELLVLIKNISIKSLPNIVPKYFYTSTPQTNIVDTRLIYALHSPLTLNLYDSLGNHTGVSTTTGEVEEQIPGTYYSEFGDAKYIYSDASTTNRIIMNGYATGTFTFNVDELTGDIPIASTTFKNIPTSTSTQVTLNILGDITTLSSMNIDKNGDGKIDEIIKTKINDLTNHDTTPPFTVATTTGTRGLHDWYTSNVNLQLIATDTQSTINSTFYSFGDTGPWLMYSTSTPIYITTEGTTKINFYSVDSAGNREATSSATVKIDKSSPEALVIFDSILKKLIVVGLDSISSTTVSTTATSSVVTDNAGHTLQIVFSPITLKKPNNRIAIAINTLIYDGVATSTSATLKYRWALSKRNLFNIFAVVAFTSNMKVESHYRPNSLSTIYMTNPTDLDDTDDKDSACDSRATISKIPGMMIIGLKTFNGNVIINN